MFWLLLRTGCCVCSSAAVSCMVACEWDMHCLCAQSTESLGDFTTQAQAQTLLQPSQQTPHTPGYLLQQPHGLPSAQPAASACLSPGELFPHPTDSMGQRQVSPLEQRSDPLCSPVPSRVLLPRNYRPAPVLATQRDSPLSSGL